MYKPKGFIQQQVKSWQFRTILKYCQLLQIADFVAENKYLEDIDKRWNELMPFILDYNNTIDASLINDISSKIRQNYLQENSVSKDTYLKLVQVQ